MDHLMDNLTFEDEPFGILNLEEIEGIHDTYYYYWDTTDVFLKIIELAIIAASVFCCVILIYVILKFDYLRTRTNIYIAHIAICSVLFYIGNPIFELLIELEIYEFADGAIICLFFEMDTTFIMLIFSFSAILAIDWLLIFIDVSWLDKYDKIQKYVVGFIYSLGAMQYVDTLLPCFGSQKIFASEIIVVEYLATIATVMVIFLISCFKKPTKDSTKYKYALTIACYVSLAWLPMLLFFFIVINVVHFSTNIMYRFLSGTFETLFKFFYLSLPIGVSFWLDYLNREFRKAFTATFGKTRRDYDQELLEEGDERGLIGNENDNVV